MREAVVRYDDFTGAAGAERVVFSIDGEHYEIDLANAAKLREIFSRYIPYARKINTIQAQDPTRERRRGEQTIEMAQRRARLTEIRRWARASGLPVSDSGRVPTAVINAYEVNERRKEAASLATPDPTPPAAGGPAPVVFFSEAS